VIKIEWDYYIGMYDRWLQRAGRKKEMGYLDAFKLAPMNEE
jgi:hypothetical protein